MLVSICQKAIQRRLETTLTPDTGQIVIRQGGKEIVNIGSGAEVGEIDIKDPRAFIAFVQGNTASGESYMAGDWDSPDLAMLFRIVGRNLMSYNQTIDTGIRKQLTRFVAWLSYLTRRSRLRAQKHISRHYDLGNDMFGKFLDAERMYSCAVYPSAQASLDEAQRNKLALLCRKSGVQEGNRLLDLGCGWGGLAIWAARHHGAQVVALTLSQRQHDYIQERIRQEGLQDQITVVLQDYRDFDPGPGFDQIISVEMIEAVGPHNFGVYFTRVHDMLKSGGKAVIQAITVPAHRFEDALYDIDFIKEYIFPGGACPSREHMNSLATQVGLEPGLVEDITEHYIATLAQWRTNFLGNMQDITKLGYDHSFCRMMSYYFAYCEAGFATRMIENIQAEYQLTS